MTLLVREPVCPLRVFRVRLVVSLLPRVVRGVDAFTAQLVVGREFGYGQYYFAANCLGFLRAPANARGSILAFFVKRWQATSGAFRRGLNEVLFRVVFPRVVATFGDYRVVRFVAFQYRCDVARREEVSNRTCGAIGPVIRVRLREFRLFFLFFVPVFLIFLFNIFFLVIFFVLFLFLFYFFFLNLFDFLYLFGRDGVFLVRTRAIMDVCVRRRGMDVMLDTPAAVATVTYAIARPRRYFAARRPFYVSVQVSALNRVIRFSFAVNVRGRGIFVVPAASACGFEGGPFAVKAPLGPLVAVAMEVLVLYVRRDACLLDLRVSSTSYHAVFGGYSFFSIQAVLQVR